MLINFYKTFFGKHLDFRVRLFNVLAMAGTVISFLMAVLGVINNEGTANIVITGISTVLSFSLLYYSYRSGRYQFCYMVTIIVIFLLLFPALFFSAGGYHSGMPAFFVFAVLFTVFMLEGKSAFILSAIELAVYITICLIAKNYPETVNWFASEEEVLLDTIIAFTVVSIILGLTMFLHFRMYNRQQRELEAAREEALAAKEILARQNDALDQLNRMKTEFLGNISHELKTPLTVVSGYAQLSGRQLEKAGKLVDGQVDESGKADIINADVINKMKFISSEAERLALMVTQILDVTRIEEGHMFIKASPCHIDEIIHSTIETYFPILNKNENKLEIHIEKDLPMIEADRVRISQVIINLIANSIRFTQGGTIEVSANSREGFVEVSVGDTGAGITPAMLPHIFERYNHKASDGRGTGTGLGLFICKYIVEGHGGEIAVESEPGEGTTVRFTVPCVSSEVC